ncbi:MAG: cupin domain-containing protein [Candidatus Acidiferrales bacterium]
MCLAIVLVLPAGPVAGQIQQTSKPAGVIVRADEGESFLSSDGQRAFLLKVGPANTGATHLVFGSATIALGAKAPWHRHDRDEEFVFVHKGQVTVTIGEKRVVAEAGEAVYVPPGTWMTIENTGSKPATVVGGFTHPEMEECFRRHIGQRIFPGDPRWPEVNRLCQITYWMEESDPTTAPEDKTLKTESAGTGVGRGDSEKVLFPDGRVMYIKVGPKSSGSTDFVLVSEDMPPGTAIPVHRHDRDEEVLFVQRGVVTVTLGEREAAVEAGDTVYIPSGTWIGVRNTSTELATIVAIFAHSDMETCFRLLGKVESGEISPKERAEYTQACAWTVK